MKILSIAKEADGVLLVHYEKDGQERVCRVFVNDSELFPHIADLLAKDIVEKRLESEGIR